MFSRNQIFLVEINKNDISSNIENYFKPGNVFIAKHLVLTWNYWTVTTGTQLDSSSLIWDMRIRLFYQKTVRNVFWLFMICEVPYMATPIRKLLKYDVFANKRIRSLVDKTVICDFLHINRRNLQYNFSYLILCTVFFYFFCSRKWKCCLCVPNIFIDM